MDKTRTKKKINTYFKNYDLYSDANPKDTIRIKYKTITDVKQTIRKLERIYKKGIRKHNRISQITNVLKQRLRVINEKDKRFKLVEKYFNFLKKRTKIKGFNERKKLTFKM